MEFQKYIDALNLMDLVIAAKGDRDQENKTWDDLYQYIYEHFPDPDTSKMNWGDIAVKNNTEVLDMKKMFNQSHDEIIAAIRAIPPVILEVTFPVWIARYLLRYESIGVVPTRLKTFDRFYKRYGTMVLATIE